MIDHTDINYLIRMAGYQTEDNPHFAETPKRWIEVITQEFGYDSKKSGEGLLTPEFTDEFRGLIVAKNIEFSGLCAHHLLPFFGKAHIGFLPDGKVLGLSKFARIVEYYTHRITIQEAATREIAQALLKLEPRGLAVVLDGFHTCMMTRGVRQESCNVTTADMHGLLRDGQQIREEFFHHLERGAQQ